MALNWNWRTVLPAFGLAHPDAEIDRLVGATWLLMRAGHDDPDCRGAAYQAVGELETLAGTRRLLDRLADEMRDAHAAHDPRWAAAHTGDLDPVIVAHFTNRGRCVDRVHPAELWLADYAAARTRGDYRGCTRLIRQAGTALPEWTRRGLLVAARTVEALEQGVPR